MAKLSIEEVEAAILEQKAKREQVLAQVNFHTGCLMTWEEVLKRLQETDDVEQEQVKAEASTPASPKSNSAILRLPAKAVKGKTIEAGQ